MPTMMPAAAAEGACLPIKSDLTCTGEFESGVRYQRRPSLPLSLPPSLLSSLSPVGKLHGISDLSLLSCCPNAFAEGGPDSSGRRLACPLPGGPLLCMLISISFCLCVASDSNLPPIRRPKLNPGCENSAESRARRRDDAASPALGARSLSSPSSPFRYLSIGSTARPTHSTLPR